MAPGDLTEVFTGGSLQGATKIYNADGASHADKGPPIPQYDVKGFYGYRRTRLRAFLLLVKEMPQDLFTELIQVNFDKWKTEFPKLYRHNRQAVDAMVPA